LAQNVSHKIRGLLKRESRKRGWIKDGSSGKKRRSFARLTECTDPRLIGVDVNLAVLLAGRATGKQK
jgi:hypothetical protein